MLPTPQPTAVSSSVLSVLSCGSSFDPSDPCDPWSGFTPPLAYGLRRQSAAATPLWIPSHQIEPIPGPATWQPLSMVRQPTVPILPIPQPTAVSSSVLSVLSCGSSFDPSDPCDPCDPWS